MSPAKGRKSKSPKDQEAPAKGDGKKLDAAEAKRRAAEVKEAEKARFARERAAEKARLAEEKSAYKARLEKETAAKRAKADAAKAKDKTAREKLALKAARKAEKERKREEAQAHRLAKAEAKALAKAAKKAQRQGSAGQEVAPPFAEEKPLAEVAPATIEAMPQPAVATTPSEKPWEPDGSQRPTLKPLSPPAPRVPSRPVRMEVEAAPAESTWAPVRPPRIPTSILDRAGTDANYDRRAIDAVLREHGVAPPKHVAVQKTGRKR